jgi:hypothetical protein
MAFAHISWYVLNDEEFKQAVEERNQKSVRTSGGHH